MVDKKHIDDLTMAYIHSYDRAMAEVKNSSFATQIAIGVTMAVSVEKERERQSGLDPFKILLENIVSGASDREEGNGGKAAGEEG